METALDIHATPLTFGVACLYQGFKPACKLI